MTLGNSEGSGEQYRLGVALVSILLSIASSVGFGVYSATRIWWAAVLLAVAVPALLAVLVTVGGEDGAIPKIGRWVLGSR